MKQKADIPYIDGDKIYNEDVKVFESQEKGFNSKLDAVKIIEYYISGYETEDYKKITKIKIKPKFSKWTTIYHSEEVHEINLHDHGPDVYNFDKDKICQKNISESIVEKIISMIKGDKKSSVILRNYLRKIGFESYIIEKLDVIISDHNEKEIEKEKLNQKFYSDVSCEKKENKKIEEQGKIYQIGDYLIRFVRHGSVFNNCISKIEYKDIKKSINTKWETVWHEESSLCIDHEEIINEIKVAELLPCDLYPIIPLIQSDLESLYIYRDYLKYHGKEFLEQNVYSFIEKGKNI